MAQTLERNQTKTSGQAVTQAGDQAGDQAGQVPQVDGAIWQQVGPPLSFEEVTRQITTFEGLHADGSRLDPASKQIARCLYTLYQVMRQQQGAPPGGQDFTPQGSGST